MTTEQLTRSDTILAVDKTKLQYAKDAALHVLAKLQATPCVTVEDEQTRSDYGNRAHVIVQDLEAEREIHVRPLIDDKSTIDGLYKEARTPWETVKLQCKKDIAASQEARKKAQDAARQLAAEAARAGDTQACVVALSQVQENSKPQGAGVTWEWVATETDVSKMDPHLLLPDMAALKRICALAKNQEHPPAARGVTFERRAKVGFR